MKPTRTTRVDDDVWKPARAAAIKLGVSFEEFIARALVNETARAEKELADQKSKF